MYENQSEQLICLKGYNTVGSYELTKLFTEGDRIIISLERAEMQIGGKRLFEFEVYIISIGDEDTLNFYQKILDKNNSK